MSSAHRTADTWSCTSRSPRTAPAHDRSSTSARRGDFVLFSAPRRLAPELFAGPDERLIDPAVVWSPAGLLLGFKRGVDRQQFELARSTTGTLRGPWELVGAPDISVRGDTVENYQFLHLGGRWQLLATSNNGNQPVRFDLAGDTAIPAGWLHWGPARVLVVPQEAWNRGAGLTGHRLRARQLRVPRRRAARRRLVLPHVLGRTREAHVPRRGARGRRDHRAQPGPGALVGPASLGT